MSQDISEGHGKKPLSLRFRSLSRGEENLLPLYLIIFPPQQPIDVLSYFLKNHFLPISRVNDFDPGGFLSGEGEISSPDAIVKLDFLSLKSILSTYVSLVPSQSPFQACGRRAIQKKGEMRLDPSGCNPVELFHPS